MSSLRASLDGLVSTFTGSILEAVRRSSVEELARLGTAPAEEHVTGRLRRRSAAEITHALVRVIALLDGRPGGMRVKEIRLALGMDPREMPRVLQEGLRRRLLQTDGRKRATTYRTV
jgi:hypothetical protein